MYWHVLAAEPDRAAWWMGLAIALEGTRANGQALMAYRTAAALGGLEPGTERYVEGRMTVLGSGAVGP